HVHRIVAIAFAQVGGEGQRTDQNQSRQHFGTPQLAGGYRDAERDRSPDLLLGDVMFRCERCFREIVSTGSVLLRSFAPPTRRKPKPGAAICGKRRMGGIATFQSSSDSSRKMRAIRSSLSEGYSL